MPFTAVQTSSGGISVEFWNEKGGFNNKRQKIQSAVRQFICEMWVLRQLEN